LLPLFNDARFLYLPHQFNDMRKIIPSQLHKRLLIGAVSLLLVFAVGTIGYWYISDKQYSFLDCFYMTFITVASIGYSEVIDLSHNPSGRIFTIIIALSGIGILTYCISMFTAIVVEGDLKETYERKKMEKLVKKMKNHYIVCGIGRVGAHIIQELRATKRSHIIVDVNEQKLHDFKESFPDIIYVKGDATDEETLVEAGVSDAVGIFAATEDDSRNLVISLTAKFLNPNVRVVVRCNEPSHIEKMKKAGADSVILPSYMGGSRMISEMIKPTAASFFESILTGKEQNIHVEEIPLGKNFVGKSLSSLNLNNYPNTLPIAIKEKEQWIYKPPMNYVITSESILIVLTIPKEKILLDKFLLNET